MESAISRAEKSNPNEVIVSKIQNHTFDQVGKSFYDETRQILHIGLDKKKARDAKIEVDIITDTTFPASAVQSNSEWKQGAKLN